MRSKVLCLMPVFATLLTAQTVWAAPSKASSGSPFGKHPIGLAGGWATHVIRSPIQNFKLSSGPYVSATIDHSLGFLGLYVVLSVSYTQSSGIANYDFTNKVAENYVGSNLTITTKQTQVSPGIRLKLFDQSIFRPYVEAGGIVGSYEVEFQDPLSISGPAPAANRDAPMKETSADLGGYAEAGMEIWFGPTFAIRGAGRIVRAHSVEFEILKKQPIAYDSEIYMLSLHKVF